MTNMTPSTQRTYDKFQLKPMAADLDHRGILNPGKNFL